MRTDPQEILRAAEDPHALEQLIVQYRPFILREAGIACRRFLTEEDDEWSVALNAFSQAVADYTADKGGFPAFARLVIRGGLSTTTGARKSFRRKSPPPMPFLTPTPMPNRIP